MSEEGTDVFGIRGRAASTPTDPSASDPLVAAPIDTATPFSGTRLLEDGAQLTTAITEGDWVSGSLAVFASGADLIAAALDPIGTAISMGVGWLLDHVDPLKSWLNELTGDAGAVAGGAATWANVSAALQASADALMRSLDSTLSTQQAETIRAYEQLQREHANHLSMASGLAGGISTGLTVASTLVQVVHDLVRDAIGDIVGKFASAALQEVLTLGLATPKIISDIVATVNKWVNRLGSKVDDLLRSFDNLSDLMKRVDRLLDRLRGVMDKLTAPSRRLTEIAERSGHVTGKWLTPKYSDRLLRRLPSAKEEAIRLLDGDAARTFFSDELGTKPWTVDDLLEKMQLRADDPLLTPVDKRGLAYIRENIAAVDEGTVLSKLDLVQKSEPGPILTSRATSRAHRTTSGWMPPPSSRQCGETTQPRSTRPASCPQGMPTTPPLLSSRPGWRQTPTWRPAPGCPTPPTCSTAEATRSPHPRHPSQGTPRPRTATTPQGPTPERVSLPRGTAPSFPSTRSSGVGRARRIPSATRRPTMPTPVAGCLSSWSIPWNRAGPSDCPPRGDSLPRIPRRRSPRRSWRAHTREHLGSQT